jgi:23S rRNA pseudouridine955/2504/2580 synthase
VGEPANSVFRIGVSICPPAARGTGHGRQLACHLQVQRTLASTCLRKGIRPGQRLDNFLLRQLKGVPKTHVYRVIRSRRGARQQGPRQRPTRAWPRATWCACRRCVWPIEPPAAPAPAREFPCCSRTTHLLAIAKPAGVAVHGGSGVSFGVIEQLRQARPQARFLELVHRLDKETSGVLLLAKKRSALTHLQDQFRARDTGKTYLALVVGAWPKNLKVIDRRCTRRWTRMASAMCAWCRRPTRTAGAPSPWSSCVRAVPHERRRRCTLLDVTIKTGRTHQIRVHLAHARATPSSATPSTATSSSTASSPRPAGLCAHVPARAGELAVRPPGQRRAHRPCSAPAARVRDTPARNMTRPRRFDLIAFDWDGTLFDSTALIVRCIQAACRDLGVAVPSDDRRRLRHRPGPARRAEARRARPAARALPRAGPALPPPLHARQDDLVLFPARWTCCRR